MSSPTLKTLASDLAQRKVSAVELAQQALAAIDAQKHLNAFLDVQPELTLAQARRADAQIARGEAGPLTGIPLAHKDIFVTCGWASTAGSKMLKGYVSPFDATVVERLAAAGMICIGKTNCDEFAMGSSGENSAYGATLNPRDLHAVPGGSTSGSAAAVAAGIVPAATGTDTGGSIRQPASFCGITGIKPTYGRVSRYGMIAFASSLDQGGPLAHTAQDCALLLNAMAGFDVRDATCLQRPAEDFTGYLGALSDNAVQPLLGVRIGVPAEYLGQGVAAEVRAVIEQALRELTKLGANVLAVSLPRTELAIPAYYVIAPAEASSNLARFDGVRYGHRCEDPKDLLDLYMRSRAEGFGAEVQRRILVGTYVLSAGYYDAYYKQAQKLRRMIAEDFKNAFAQCDFIVGPVAPTVAWNLGDKADDPVANYLADIFTLGASLAGLPGMSVPAGVGADSGRPVGMQIIGNYFDEARMLAVADAFQRARGQA
jgi:aspartyl-tRNA(Asn)/glutamyl-tRNA(Gln) amidotransferase subunit A